MKALQKIKHLKLKGMPEERGKQYGLECKVRIKKSIKFYKEIFQNKGVKNVTELGKYYGKKIQEFDEKYYVELKAIAKAAKVDVNWVFAINARTEILSYANECSAIYNTYTNHLAQTWDWGKKALDHVVVLDVTPINGCSYITVTEAGMLAKIGMNQLGLGVCLNALSIYEKLDGVPIHIILRKILSCSSLEQAHKEIIGIPTKTAGNTLIAKGGYYLDVEFAGENKYLEKNMHETIYHHTNHYLMADITDKTLEKHKSSYSRYKRLKQLITNSNKEVNVTKLLCDETGNQPILRELEDNPVFGDYGTVLAVLMDLNKKTFYVTDGYPGNTSFLEVKQF